MKKLFLSLIATMTIFNISAQKKYTNILTTELIADKKISWELVPRISATGALNRVTYDVRANWDIKNTFSLSGGYAISHKFHEHHKKIFSGMVGFVTSYKVQRESYLGPSIFYFDENKDREMCVYVKYLHGTYSNINLLISEGEILKKITYNANVGITGSLEIEDFHYSKWTLAGVVDIGKEKLHSFLTCGVYQENKLKKEFGFHLSVGLKYIANKKNKKEVTIRPVLKY